MNSISIIGRLTADPDQNTYDASDGPGTLANFRVAVKRGARDRTDFFDVVAFGATAKAVIEHVGKGRRVGVNGRLETTEWETSQGERRHGVQICANQVDFLDQPRP